MSCLIFRCVSNEPCPSQVNPIAIPIANPNPDSNSNSTQNPSPCQSNPIARPHQTSSMEIRMPIFERLQLICNVFHCCASVCVCVGVCDGVMVGRGIKFLLIISIAFVRRSSLCSPSNDSYGGIKNVIYNSFCWQLTESV